LASTLTGTRLSACPRALTIVFFKISEIFKKLFCKKSFFSNLFDEAHLEVRYEAR
jgi:hypothetical protein